MNSRRQFLQRASAAVTAALVAPTTACDPREYARAHGATLRLSIAAGNIGGVFYPYAGAIAAVITAHVPRVAATAEVTGGTIDNMQFLQHGTADLAFATADLLEEAVDGSGVFAKLGRVPVRAIAVLYYSYFHIATLAETGIASIDDLRGRVVSVGSAGSSTEIFALRLMRAAGMDTERDVRRQGLGIGPAADALRDRKVDALFWIGGVPTGAILELASAAGRRLVLLPNARLLPQMRAAHGDGVYVERTIRAGAYKGIEADVPVLGLANLLVADARMSDELAYEVTQALFVHTDEIAAVHNEARHLRVESAVEGSPIAFHDGARRFYTERGVWKS